MTEGEGGASVFAGIFVLPPAQSVTIEMSYELPPDVVVAAPDGGWNYQLRVQKQPGTEAVPIEIEVLLPEGYAIEGASTWNTHEPGIAVWSGGLREDRTLELTIVPSPSP